MRRRAGRRTGDGDGDEADRSCLEVQWREAKGRLGEAVACIDNASMPTVMSPSWPDWSPSISDPPTTDQSLSGEKGLGDCASTIAARCLVYAARSASDSLPSARISDRTSVSGSVSNWDAESRSVVGGV